VKDKYNLPNSYIFYLGNLEPRKNVETLIMAFSELEDESINLVIAGSQAWKYKKIYKLWQNSPAKKRIKFLGYVDAEDKPALYSLAEIFVYPSIYEGFGLPPLEAMACKTPVITSFNSSLVEAVGKAGLLVDPNNYNDLAKTIESLLVDKNLQNAFIEKGLDQSQKFRWENTAKQVLALMKK
jgi:glycosyltransferase involved in cell wall biosynthesis